MAYMCMMCILSCVLHVPLLDGEHGRCVHVHVHPSYHPLLLTPSYHPLPDSVIQECLEAIVMLKKLNANGAAAAAA